MGGFLGPRDEVSAAIFKEVEEGRGVETEDGRPAVYLDTTRIPERDADVSLPYMLRRSFWPTSRWAASALSSQSSQSSLWSRTSSAA